MAHAHHNVWATTVEVVTFAESNDIIIRIGETRVVLPRQEAINLCRDLKARLDDSAEEG